MAAPADQFYGDRDGSAKDPAGNTWWIATGGPRAILTYTFSLAVTVVLICEVIGGRRPRTGRRLGSGAVVIAALPVVLSIAQLVMP